MVYPDHAVADYIGEVNTSRLSFIPDTLGKWLDRVQVQPEIIVLATALIVGILTGTGAIILAYLIEGVAWVGYEWFPEVTSGLGKTYIVIVPAVGGLLVGLLTYTFAREAKGHGVPEVMAAVALRGGRIRPIVAVVKSIASALTIGTGGSAGREGPIVQIGAGIGSSMGQLLKLSNDRISNLVACGAAAGIAAAFNAPIAGVIFALEVILGRFSVRYFSSVVVAAVAASVIGRVTFGDTPAFRIPFEYGINSLWEFLFYPVLGLLAAFVGVGFTRLLYWAEDVFENATFIPEWFQPAIGGALLGVLAFAYPLIRLTQPVTWERVPQVFGVGFEVIEAALANQFLFGTAVLLLIAKILATVLTLGSGGSGGVFAPSLFMGAMLGAAFELGIDQIFPGVSAPAGAYALVGMAAVFAASAHAPITAVIMLFELTGDYRIILPLMLTVVIATGVSQRLMHGESIYTLKLRKRGIRLSRGRDVDILQSVNVEEVMAYDYESVSMNLTLDELSDLFAHTRHHGLMVLDEHSKLWGVVTLTDLDRAVANKLPRSTPVADIATTWPHLTVAYPDETMGDALARMSSRDLGRLPVVSRADPYEALGLIRRQAITNAYHLALARRSEQEQEVEVAAEAGKQPEQRRGTEYIDIVLVEGDSIIGQTVAEVAPRMPKDCVLVAIRRDDTVIIPHGDTVFRVGDVVSAFVVEQDATELFRALHGPADEPTEETT